MHPAEESKKEKRSLQKKGTMFPEKVCLTELGFFDVSGKPTPISGC